MKQIYLLMTLLMTGSLCAQTTVPYLQQTANYETFFTDGGGNFDNGGTEFGMWANGGNTKSVAWRHFTESGDIAGTQSAMAVGDSFTITLSATRAWGQIGISLLGTYSTGSWANRASLYSVQVNLDGNSGAFDLPWQIVSTGGTIDSSTIFGSDTYADTKFKFTLDTATTMTIVINDDVANTFNVTVNNPNIVGYAIYQDNDWNGSSNANVFWKPTTEYTYAMTLSTDEFSSSKVTVFSSEGKLNIKGLTSNENYSLSIFDTMGRQVKSLKSNATIIDISELNTAVYFLTLEISDGEKYQEKIIKQ